MLKRELSCFLCRELLYEHVAGTIDTRRSEAVQHHLSDCTECKSEQEGLRGAISYSRKLASVDIRPEYLAEISNPVPVKQLLAKKLKWQSWPEPLRWTVESLAFAGVIAIAVGLFGQQIFKGKSDNKNIAVVEHPTETINVAQMPDQTPNEFGEDEFTDHHGDEEISQVTSVEKRIPSPEPDVKVVQAEEEIAQNAIPQPTVTDSTVSRTSSGFLYRLHLKVNNLDMATDELVQKISSLGGKKAGEVPLGWKRANGSYFHFSMGETSYSQLAEFLKKYGAREIAKETNPRVMPKGSIRMILEIDGSAQQASMPPDETSGDAPEVSTPPSEPSPDEPQ